MSVDRRRHQFDSDGHAVLERRELAQENAILKERIAQLEFQQVALVTKLRSLTVAGFFTDLIIPTKH